NAHRTGTSTRLMTNALLLTAALYSRAATAHTLGSMALAPLVLGPRDADEDFLQRRPGQLEVPHRPAAHQRGQDALRVGARRQPQLLQLAEVGDALHPRQPLQAGAALQPDADGVAAVLVLDRLQGAVEDLLAAVDHEDEVAHLLGHAHVMGREDDGGPAFAQIQYGFAEHLGVDRVQAAERLVEDDQLRPGDDGGDELDLLRHALRQR